VWSTFTTAVFAYLGTELVGVTGMWLRIGLISFLGSLLLTATDTFQLGKLQILAEIFPEPSSLPSTEFFSSTLFWYFS
jgi:hypothetical protein